AWSIDALSVLGLASTVGLIVALGELLYNSPVVGRVGAALFLFCSPVRHLPNEAWGFWKETTFVNQRYLPFAVGIILLVSIFLIDQARRGRSTTAVAEPCLEVAGPDPTEPSNSNQPKTGLLPRLALCFFF